MPLIPRTYRISQKHDKAVKSLARRLKRGESEVIRRLIEEHA